jgi:hypothetical protein
MYVYKMYKNVGITHEPTVGAGQVGQYLDVNQVNTVLLFVMTQFYTLVAGH